MALKVHNRIQESNSDSMIDAQVNLTKACPNAPAQVSSSPSDARDISQCIPDENTQPRSDVCTSVCSGATSSIDSKEEFSHVEEKYHIEPSLLGEGHHGSVRKCFNRVTGKHYAVKTICKNAPSVNVKGIQREVTLLESLNYQRILQLDDVFEDSQYVHLVTELCTGGELFDKIVEKTSKGSGCFSELEAARMLHQLLEAVSYLHQNNIVHRDIKPENILFETKDEDSDIKLIDFGLARKHKSREAPMTTIVGTPYYLAPEVLAKSYDKAVDLWSIGVIAYILLCGYPPFNGASNKEVYASVKRGLYHFPLAEWGHVSHAAKDFVVRLLQTDPRCRMTAEQALSHPWIVRHNFESIPVANTNEHKDVVHIVNDEVESSTSFVEVVLEEALHKGVTQPMRATQPMLVCGGIIPTSMHC